MQTIVSDAQQSTTLSVIPPELQSIYNELYAKIELIISGGAVFDIRKDPTILRIVLQSAMVCVEEFRNKDGNGWNGPEKKRIALALIKFVLTDLAAKGKLDPAVAKEICDNIDFWGGLAMDLACDVANYVIEVGQKFTEDVRTEGCKAACTKNCCSVC